MFKKLRDFIYDINDIFVAVIILALAAGIIYWRTTNIIAYPQYLADKTASGSVDVDFSDINLEPDEVDLNVNPNPEEEGPYGTVDDKDLEEAASGVGGQGEDTEDTENTENSTDDNNDESTEVNVTIPLKTSWQEVAKDLSSLGLIEDSDEARRNLVLKASELKLDTRLYPGTYTITKGASVEEIIKILCRAN